MKNNIAWINSYKVLCIFLVYLNHSEIYCGCTIGVLRNIYLPLFVPAFFFITGYLIFMKQMAEPQISMGVKEWFESGLGGGKYLIYSSIYKIAIPSVLFASLIWFPKKILRGQTLEWDSFLIETIGGCSMWFTSALVVAYITIVILLLSRIKSIWFYVGVGLFIAYVGKIAFDSGLTIYDNNNFPWYWKSSMAAVFYISLGGLYKKYESFLSKTIKIDHWPLLILIAVVYSCYCLLDFRAYAGGLDSSPLTISSALLSIVGILLLVGICKKIPITKFSDYWGRNTLGLYFVCGAIPNTVAIVLQKIMPLGTSMVLICWFLSFAVALIVVYFLNRYLPFMFDIRKLRIKCKDV